MCTIFAINWDAVGAVATTISTLAVLIALIYGIRQLQETQRSRVITAFLPLFQELQSAKSTKLRWSLYNEIPADTSKASVEQEAIMNEIVNQLDFLGFLAEEELLEFELIAPFFYGTTIRCWRRMEPYIQKQRTLRKSHFAIYFEKLMLRCREYVATHRPDEEILLFRQP